MENKIRFSSDGYTKIAGNLKEVADVLASVHSTLSAISLKDEEGGELRLISRVLSLRHRKFIGEMIASAQLKLLARALKSEEEDVRDTIRAINDAVRTMGEAEENIVKLMNGDLTADQLNKKENPYGLTDEELEKERRESIDKMLEILEKENDMLDSFIDEEELKKLTGKLAELYMILAGDPSALASNDARKILIALLNSMSSANKFPDGFLDAYGDAAEHIEYGKNMAVSVVDILENGGGEDFEKFLKALPITEDINLGDLDALKDSADVLEKVVDAYNQYRQISSMDPAVVESICSGLRQSGDPTMAEAADMLEKIQDPECCMLFCAVGNGVELVLENGSTEVRDVILKMYPGTIGKNIINISKETTEIMTNSSGIVESAMQVERLNNARQSAYDAVQNAADMYKKNPTNENYQKVIDAHNTYEALAAESMDAFADMAKETNDSGLGRLNPHDTSMIESVADIHRSSINNNGLTVYA